VCACDPACCILLQWCPTCCTHLIYLCHVRPLSVCACTHTLPPPVCDLCPPIPRTCPCPRGLVSVPASPSPGSLLYSVSGPSFPFCPPCWCVQLCASWPPYCWPLLLAPMGCSDCHTWPPCSIGSEAWPFPLCLWASSVVCGLALAYSPRWPAWNAAAWTGLLPPWDTLD